MKLLSSNARYLFSSRASTMHLRSIIVPTFNHKSPPQGGSSQSPIGHACLVNKLREKSVPEKIVHVGSWAWKKRLAMLGRGLDFQPFTLLLRTFSESFDDGWVDIQLNKYYYKWSIHILHLIHRCIMVNVILMFWFRHTTMEFFIESFVICGSWLLALGSWLLALGSWLLALGSWLLA